MPLSASTGRKKIHRRSIECHGYQRDDGLWDIEGHLTDTKTYTFKNRDRGDISPFMRCGCVSPSMMSY